MPENGTFRALVLALVDHHMRGQETQERGRFGPVGVHFNVSAEIR